MVEAVARGVPVIISNKGKGDIPDIPDSGEKAVAKASGGEAGEVVLVLIGRSRLLAVAVAGPGLRRWP